MSNESIVQQPPNSRSRMPSPASDELLRKADAFYNHNHEPNREDNRHNPALDRDWQKAADELHERLNRKQSAIDLPEAGSTEWEEPKQPTFSFDGARQTHLYYISEDAPELSGTEYKVLSDMGRYIDTRPGVHQHRAWMTEETLAKNAKISLSTVKHVIRSLKEKGLIRIHRWYCQGRWRNQYELTFYKPKKRREN